MNKPPPPPFEPIGDVANGVIEDLAHRTGRNPPMNAVAAAATPKPDRLPSNALTPMQMLQIALERGAELATLKTLMDMQERWERNQARKAFDQAIADAKAEIKPIVRNAVGHNNKRYANSAAIATTVDPILARYGLSYRYRTQQTDRIQVTCILSHRDGHSEETTLAGPPDNSGNKNFIQAIGSTLTYLQRYSLVLALGLAVADDDDGRAAGAGDAISPDQLAELIKVGEEVGATKDDERRLLKKFGIGALADMPAAKFSDALAALNSKRGRAA